MKKRRLNPSRTVARKSKPIITREDLEALAVGSEGDGDDLMLGHYAVKYPGLGVKELLRRFGRKRRSSR